MKPTTIYVRLTVDTTGCEAALRRLRALAHPLTCGPPAHVPPPRGRAFDFNRWCRTRRGRAWLRDGPDDSYRWSPADGDAEMAAWKGILGR